MSGREYYLVAKRGRGGSSQRSLEPTFCAGPCWSVEPGIQARRWRIAPKQSSSPGQTARRRKRQARSSAPGQIGNRPRPHGQKRPPATPPRVESAAFWLQGSRKSTRSGGSGQVGRCHCGKPTQRVDFRRGATASTSLILVTGSLAKRAISDNSARRYRITDCLFAREMKGRSNVTD